MPYPKKLLNPDETVALDLHPHWWIFAAPAAALVASIVAAIAIAVALDEGNARKYLLWVALAAIVLTSIWTLKRYMKWITTNFVITSDRIIFRHGVVGKNGIEIPLERVNNVNFSQTAFERILGAGDLLIESGGEDGQQRFSDVRKPQNVQNLVHTQVEAKFRHRGSFSTPPASP
ncbi:MAG: PH domain-containing protein, partial [Ilumatobacteraceae bacterium]